MQSAVVSKLVYGCRFGRESYELSGDEKVHERYSTHRPKPGTSTPEQGTIVLDCQSVEVGFGGEDGVVMISDMTSSWARYS